LIRPGEAYRPRSGAPEGGGAGAFVADARKVELWPQELVSVTGCPAWNGEAYGKHSWPVLALKQSWPFAAVQLPGTVFPPGVMMRADPPGSR
jgi:hypothetical protein